MYECLYWQLLLCSCLSNHKLWKFKWISWWWCDKLSIMQVHLEKKISLTKRLFIFCLKMENGKMRRKLSECWQHREDIFTDLFPCDKNESSCALLVLLLLEEYVNDYKLLNHVEAASWALFRPDCMAAYWGIHFWWRLLIEGDCRVLVAGAGGCRCKCWCLLFLN